MKEIRWPNPLYLVYIVCALITLTIVYLWFSPTGRHVSGSTGGQLAVVPPKSLPIAPPEHRSPQTAGRAHIGIVAGHLGFDSGAVCPDGLTEQSINASVANLVLEKLKDIGVEADLLEEFDVALQDYTATALVSIHSDSCIYPEATGFKVASLEGSANPENQILVNCLVEHYGERTGLPYHQNSITYDMTQYHAFTDINSKTAGAIIEIGFMLADREKLTGEQEVVAQGIFEGIQCYLEDWKQRR